MGRPWLDTYPTLQSATRPSCVSFIVVKRFSTPSHFHKLLHTGHSNDVPSAIFSYSGNRFTISSNSANRKSYFPFPLRFLMGDPAVHGQLACMWTCFDPCLLSSSTCSRSHFTVEASSAFSETPKYVIPHSSQTVRKDESTSQQSSMITSPSVPPGFLFVSRGNRLGWKFPPLTCSLIAIVQ